jgi:hypothetical protein
MPRGREGGDQLDRRMAHEADEEQQMKAFQRRRVRKVARRSRSASRIASPTIWPRDRRRWAPSGSGVGRRTGSPSGRPRSSFRRPPSFPNARRRWSLSSRAIAPAAHNRIQRADSESSTIKCQTEKHVFRGNPWELRRLGDSRLVSDWGLGRGTPYRDGRVEEAAQVGPQAERRRPSASRRDPGRGREDLHRRRLCRGDDPQDRRRRGGVFDGALHALPRQGPDPAGDQRRRDRPAAGRQCRHRPPADRRRGAGQG